MKKEKELIYWAGVFDFAGSIRWRRTRQWKAPYTSLGSKQLELLEQLKTLFGGGIQKGKKYFRWSAQGTPARNVIKQLAPYMQRKLDAELLTWQPMKRGPKRNFPRAKFVSLLDENEG